MKKLSTFFNKNVTIDYTVDIESIMSRRSSVFLTSRWVKLYKYSTYIGGGHVYPEAISIYPLNPNPYISANKIFSLLVNDEILRKTKRST
jgi:hypothetical protein